MINHIRITNLPLQEIEIGGKKSTDIDIDFNRPVYVRGSKYEGKYTVTPNPIGETLPTMDKTLDRDITVKAIPYYEVSNEQGVTCIIGKEVEVYGN